jgi:hypothetical protein
MRPALNFGLVLALMVPVAVMAPAQEVAEEPPIVYYPPPEGYPWKMGDATISLDGKPRSYTTFDFSIGAFDAAVQFRADYDCSGSGACKETGKVALVLGAHPDGDSEADHDRVFIKALFARLPSKPKKSKEVTVEIRNVGGQDGVYLRSNGPAKLSLTAIKRGKDGRQSYGTLRATVTATVCEATEDALIKGGDCQSFNAVYDTEVQFDSV